ncbi:MAG: YiiD C-terminal domain-containing protein [Rhodocyclaceae bacterium]|nr:YiiD C-terminal domain-containing protein [Rhodocyclaceae bacterium]
MTPQALEHYLHAHIPLSLAMQVHVEEVDTDHIVLSAPLAPNINHRETVFGGSASAVAILAAWSLLNTRLRSEGIATKLVIQRNTMSYEAPIAGSFTAISRLEAPEKWAPFMRTLLRHGKARIRVLAELHYAGQVAGRLEGEFVALGADPL